MAADSKPTSIRLDRDARAHLDEAGMANRSDYLRRVLDLHARAWRESLAYLRGAGWTDAELRAACDALNGLWLTPGIDLGQQLALSLHDAAALDGAAARWGVGDAWAERCQQVADDEPTARALWTLVTEYWLGNAAVARTIDR